tara:strand:+ start:131 stop:691 length:561 start_codon:yes stop_codon:yes gene_type:complete
VVKRFKTGQSRKKRRSNEGRPQKNAPLRDKGTPELQIKRIMIVNGGNPHMSTTPIDIMFERSMINQNEYNSGLIYHYLHSRVFSKPFPESNTGKLAEPIRSRQASSKVTKRDVENWIVFKDITSFIIHEVGQMTYDCMKNLIIYQEHPTYLLHNQIRIKDNHHKEMVKNALKSVTKFFDNARRKKN